MYPSMSIAVDVQFSKDVYSGLETCGVKLTPDQENEFKKCSRKDQVDMALVLLFQERLKESDKPSPSNERFERIDSLRRDLRTFFSTVDETVHANTLLPADLIGMIGELSNDGEALPDFVPESKMQERAPKKQRTENGEVAVNSSAEVTSEQERMKGKKRLIE